MLQESAGHFEHILEQLQIKILKRTCKNCSECILHCSRSTDYHPKMLRRNRFNRTINFRHFSWKSGEMPRIISRPAAPQAAAAERLCRPMLPPCEKLSAMASAQTSALGLEGRC